MVQPVIIAENILPYLVNTVFGVSTEYTAPTIKANISVQLESDWNYFS